MKDTPDPKIHPVYLARYFIAFALLLVAALSCEAFDMLSGNLAGLMGAAFATLCGAGLVKKKRAP